MIDNVQNMTILSNYYDKKDFAGLIDYCNYKIELDNSNYLFLGARGKAYFELNEYDKAILDITKALDLNPSYATGLYNRGICYYETDKYELAIKDLEQAKLLSTELYSIDFYLGGSYCCIKNYEKAIELLSNHLLDYEDEVALKWRADIYYLTDQFEKANNDLAELLLIESQDIEVFEKINKIKKSLDTISDFDNSNKLFPFIDIGFSTIYNNNDCGIYILEFSNSEYYIGQATKIQDRIKQHFKKYNDIVTVYFKPVVADLLLSEENITISIFEKSNLRIRNLKQLDFFNLFNEVNQEKWVNDLNFNMLTGSKFNNEPVREKFRDRFLIFKGKPYFNDLILLLSQYFKLCIPN